MRVALVIPPVILALSGFYAFIRKAALPAEVLFYLALWLAFPIIGVRLSYLCFTVGYPLVDRSLQRADLAPGLDWRAWGEFVSGRPWFWQAQRLVYMTHAWQPIVAIIALARSKPRRGNAELFQILTLSLILTLGIVTVLPSVGALNLDAPTAPVVLAIRHGSTDPLPYAGIVAFPSFHATMMILFAYACRGIRWLFIVSLLVNAFGLLSIPLAGDHYFVDVFAGAAVTALSVALVRFAQARWRQGLTLVPAE